MKKNVITKCMEAVETRLIYVGGGCWEIILSLHNNLFGFCSEIQHLLDSKREIKAIQPRKYYVSWSLPFK